MSFYTGLIFYRPREPPVITGADLSSFVGAILKLGILKNDGYEISAKFKFGDRIDQDDSPADWDEPLDESGMIRVSREIGWDVEEQFAPVEQVSFSVSSGQATDLPWLCLARVCDGRH